MKRIFPKANQLLFKDVETTRQYKYFTLEDFKNTYDGRIPTEKSEKEIFEIADPRGFKLFEKKWKRWTSQKIMDKDISLSDFYYQRSGLFPEFSKIVCIVIGFVYNDEIRIKRFFGHDEKMILADFIKTVEGDWFFHEVEVTDYRVNNKLRNINAVQSPNVKIQTLGGSDSYSWNSEVKKWFKRVPKLKLCGHNLKGFDLPMLYKRCIVHGFNPPSIVPSSFVPKYENTSIDTMMVWSHNSFNNYATLDEICYALDLPSPKQSLSGADVSDCYWATNDFEDTDREENLISIVDYCELDTRALIDVAEIFNNLKIIMPTTELSEINENVLSESTQSN